MTQVAIQFRKPGMSLSNWLHPLPSLNPGAGPEGMNGEEGPVLGRPQLAELGQHFPLEGYWLRGSSWAKSN